MCICLLIFITCLFISLQTAVKTEEEEFNTGPLSVLMMSVKNNTQVMCPSSDPLAIAHLHVNENVLI